MFSKYIAFVSHNYPEIMKELCNQIVFLSLLPLLISVVLGIGISIALSRLRKVRAVVSSIVSMLQLIPSLVMLTFMILLGFGIGYKPAIVAITIYSILPIIQNTLVAIDKIDDGYYRLGRLYKFNRLQVARYIEFPLILPYILTGVRLSIIYINSCSVLANMIGAGGMGRYILTGVNQLQYHLILVGVIPIMVITILSDVLLSKLIKQYT